MCELRSFASAKEWLSNCPMSRCIHAFSCVRLNTSCTKNIVRVFGIVCLVRGGGGGQKVIHPSLPCCLSSLPCLALPCLALPCLALPCLALPCLALPCLASIGIGIPLPLSHQMDQLFPWHSPMLFKIPPH